MKRRGVGRIMIALVPLALVFWLARPVVSMLVPTEARTHSHPIPGFTRKVTPEGYINSCSILLGRARTVHPDPFWPRYWRELMGWPWPGDYACPVVPPGTEIHSPAYGGEMISADEY